MYMCTAVFIIRSAVYTKVLVYTIVHVSIMIRVLAVKSLHPHALGCDSKIMFRFTFCFVGYIHVYMHCILYLADLC